MNENTKKKTYKTFEDLIFKPWFEGVSRAHLEFNNGYGVSVLIGSKVYSNGIDTYELAILYRGELSYSSGLTDDVLANLTKDEVTKYMKKVQDLQV